MAAETIYLEARAALTAEHPYLAFALTRLKPAEDPASGVVPAGTDGERFVVSPGWEPDAGASADVLFHSLSHCLRGHLFDGRLSWLACDLDAALWAASNAPERCPVKDAPLFLDALTHLRGARDALSIQARIEEEPFFAKNQAPLQRLLALDDHRLWPSARAREALRTSAGGEGLSGRWRREARRAGGGMQGRGSAGEGRRLDVRLSNAESYDFSRVLRRYASVREVPRDDPDAFQTAWYAYGLEFYGDMPLIEPAEYREESRLEQLVIAIDTSGSCSRGLTRRFLEQTRNILETEGLFFRRFKLHILQCDARVQRDDRIESMAEFRRYIENLVVIGGGGTDFRPAFERVDALVGSGELRDLKGMLYFSDGRGIFPSSAPKYEVTFVFFDREYDEIDVPDWVKRLKLGDGETDNGGWT